MDKEFAHQDNPPALQRASAWQQIGPLESHRQRGCRGTGVIPRAHITAWRAVAPWSTDAQVEQDLILSRALVQIFSEAILSSHLSFRGGTAIHKLFLNPPSRYSEDLDLVQLKPEPIGPTLTALHQTLDSWLGEPRRKQSEGRVTLIYRFDSEIAPITPLRLKVEINTREHFSVLGYLQKQYNVKSAWFDGATELLTYSIEELLGTKLRALYQRKQGRDLFDLAVAFEKIPKLDASKIVACFLRYMEHDKASISRAEFESNLSEKLEDPTFTEDISPLLVFGEHPSPALRPDNAGRMVMEKLIALIPGHPWKSG
jgi:predicted nucleotidyltransferase component of viral defense system